MRERRRAHRVRLSGRVHLTIGDLQMDLPAADISVSGVGVLIDAGLLEGRPAGQVGICRIEAAELGEPIEAFVSLMRARRLGDRRLLGLRFESIGDDALERIRACRQALSAG